MKVSSLWARRWWIVGTATVCIGGVAIAMVVARPGEDNGGIIFVAAWLVFMLVLGVRSAADVREGGPFGVRARPGATAEADYVEVYGTVIYRNPLGRGGPMPFGRLAFDDEILGIRGPGTDVIVKRRDVHYLQVSDTTFGPRVTVIRPDGSEGKTEFSARAREELVKGLQDRGWPLQVIH